MKRFLATALAAAVLVLPACGKRGDPRPPFSRIPQPVTELAVVQRGDTLELRYVAPQATAGNLPLEGLQVELLRADRAGDFDKMALRELRPTEPGATVVQALPLPAVGTPLRFAARAIAGNRRSPLAGPVSHVVAEPPPAPTALRATLTADVVQLAWTAPAGWTPPVPKPSPAPGATPAPAPPPAAEPKTTPPPAAPKSGGRGGGGRGGRAGGARAGGTLRPGAQRPNVPFNPGFNVYRRVGDGGWQRVTPTPLLFTEWKDAAAPTAGTLCYAVRYASSGAPYVESEATAPACVVRVAPAPSPEAETETETGEEEP